MRAALTSPVILTTALSSAVYTRAAFGRATFRRPVLQQRNSSVSIPFVGDGGVPIAIQYTAIASTSSVRNCSSIGSDCETRR